MDKAAEIAGIDHVHRGGGEAREIRGAAGGLHILVALDIGLERDGAHQLAALDQASQGIEQLAVERIGEMLALEEFSDPMIGRVVHQNRAQQGLLRLEVVRRFAHWDELYDSRALGKFVFLGLHREPFNGGRGQVLENV